MYENLRNMINKKWKEYQIKKSQSISKLLFDRKGNARIWYYSITKYNDLTNNRGTKLCTDDCSWLNRFQKKLKMVVVGQSYKLFYV